MAPNGHLYIVRISGCSKTTARSWAAVSPRPAESGLNLCRALTRAAWSDPEHRTKLNLDNKGDQCATRPSEVRHRESGVKKIVRSTRYRTLLHNSRQQPPCGEVSWQRKGGPDAGVSLVRPMSACRVAQPREDFAVYNAVVNEHAVCLRNTFNYTL